MTKKELLATAKPILFNSDMVRAILDGRKTVTRRVMKPQPLFKAQRKFIFDDDCPKKYEDCDNIFKNARYQVGDILYVRETFRGDNYIGYEYRADGLPHKQPHNLLQWRPSIHMPKEAARIFLRVTSVRIEQIHDITTEKAIEEGFESAEHFGKTFFAVYPDADGDTFVWVYEFERVECDEY